MTASDVIILGGGGHARVVLSVLRATGVQVVGFTDPSPASGAALPTEVRHLGADEVLRQFDPRHVELVNGLGSVRSTDLRARVFDQATALGFRFHTLRHPSAIVAEDVQIELGVQLMAGVIVQTGTRIGRNALVNTGAILDHDCTIGDHVHVAPGAVVSGQVTIGDRAHVGVGATIRQGIRIGAGATVGAGAVVVNDVDAGCTVVGVPARPKQAARDANQGVRGS